MTSRSVRILLASVFVFTFLTSSAFGQGSKRKSVYDSIEDADRDRPDKRAEWNMKGREAPKGQSAAALRLRAHRQKMAMRAAREAALAARPAAPAPAPPAAGWVNLGPAPLVSDSDFFGDVTGRSTAVAIDPSDSTGGTVYAGGAYGGVWKSRNAINLDPTTVVWTPVTDQQASLAVGAVSVQPVTTNPVVLVGTGEPNNAIDSYYGVGVLRSADGGTTWSQISTASNNTLSLFGLGFTKFAWSTATTSRVVGATATTAKGFDEGAINSSTNRGLYLSTDAGLTWSYQALSDGSAPISVSDVVFNPKAGPNGMFFASVRSHGIYSSPDGTTWTRLSTQPNNLTLLNCPVSSLSSCPLYRGQLAVTPGRDEMYFWYINSSIVDQGVWRTTDHGQTWTQINETGFTSCGDVQGGCGAEQAFYNMDLAAVPVGTTGTATGLYLGAVNLFKCSLTSNTATACTSNWLNLTHVYGCSTIAKVHADEHGIDFKIVGGKDIMYFGNDGGVYRALDAFTGLATGTCGGHNQFDNLNTTMGSMTQFVSFSQHPTDQNTVLGGTQDNGSPASSTATTSLQWITVNGGDGGFNAINPTNPVEWFTANTDVSIQKCSTGIACNSGSFISILVPGDLKVGGDSGPFYTPYILDPQNPGELLVVTCRLWRGSTAGITNFTALSVNFDTLSNAACTGNEINLGRSIAAGGPKDVNNFSNVVYATSEGTGPNGGFSGGEVWSTTNAATTQMSNVTGSINPQHYTISSVAIDNSDATGKTAYVGIMGFGVSHVFKTTNAGGTGQPSDWTDWTGSGANALPDAPVNALLVDSSVTPAQIYAGTDVGVFVSSTTSASWTEVGAMAQPGAVGYLPNVPVTAIRMFNSGGTKKLRVSTYGRGIWEFALATGPPPEFGWMTSGSAAHTVLAGQSTLAYNFTATPAGSSTFPGDVTFSCPNLPDSTVACIFNTGQADPSKIAAGSGATNVALIITTTGPNTGTGATIQRRAERRSPRLPLATPIAGILFAAVAGRKVSKHSAIAGLCVALALLGLLMSCGGSSSPPPPPPPVTVTVTPNTTVNLYANAAGNAWPANLTQQKFSAVVNNSTNQAVTWAVAGGAANGSIDATGLYASPATVPNPATVTVTATAQAGGTPGSGKANILTPTPLGTFNVSVMATEGSTNHSQNVSLTVQ